MSRTCDTCRFWVEISDKDGVFTDACFDVLEEQTGQCRRYPPASGFNPFTEQRPAYSSDGALRAIWPITWDRHWCGEHKPRLVVAPGGDAA